MSFAAALLGAGIGTAPARRLEAYAEALLAANRKFNLTGAETLDELVPHVLDALTVAPYLAGPLVDVGSGGGLPAIPLVIATGTEATLVESNAKKARFLREVAQRFDLPVRVVALRAETAGHDPGLRERFATATARAVSSAPTVLEYVLPLLAVGGRAVLQRGAVSDAERNAVSDAAPMLGGRLAAEVPLEGERRLLIVEKTSATPARFPRRPGIPEKRPLCLSPRLSGS